MMKKDVVIISLLILNVLCCVVLYKMESRTHYLQHYIERRNGMEQEKLPADYWCIQGWSNTLAKLDYDADVVFFGHSHIYDSDFRQYFPNKKVVNLGYPGNNLKGMLLCVDQISSMTPEKVFIMGGTNSLWYSKEEFECSYDALITTIRNVVPYAELYLINILPQCDGEKGSVMQNIKIRNRNEFINSYAISNGIKMIDVYSVYSDENGQLLDSLSHDGLHLKSRAYDRWAECLKPYI